ncbi:MAG: ABC transporter permease [Spirochaetaceae bacterium]|nr:MAG: ABC transporter permease [Spirochaetaceae bacterium]
MSAFSRIYTRLSADWAMARRDPISLYILLAPVIFALLIRAFVPGAGEQRPTFAVLDTVPETSRELLSSFGELVLFEDRSLLEARVNRPDDVPGFIMTDAGLTMLLQGNESETSERYFRMVLLDVMSGGRVLGAAAADTGGVTETAAAESMLLPYLAIVVLMTTVLLGGMQVGFLLVEDRSTGAIRALAVSPLRLRDYLAARYLYTIAQSGLGMIAAAYIMLGVSANLPALLLVVLIGGLSGALVGTLLGTLADSQIAAMGVGKLIIPLFLLVPLLSLVIPASFRPLLWPFPNFWLWSMLESMYVGHLGYGFGLSALLAASLGLLANVPLMIRLKARVKLR